jgi:hypothetical protein
VTWEMRCLMSLESIIRNSLSVPLREDYQVKPLTFILLPMLGIQSEMDNVVRKEGHPKEN